MSDDARDDRSHPHVAHYGWPPDPVAEDRFHLTPEKTAKNAQHAVDKQAVEGGRVFRLVLAAPIILWSFVGGPALLLLAIVAVLGMLGKADVDAREITPGLVGFYVLLVFIEIASIWEGLLLMRDRLDAGRWCAVLALTVVVAVASTAAFALYGDVSTAWMFVIAAVWYCVVIALWQWRRSVRLAAAVERLESHSP